MDIEVLIETYSILKQYIPQKDRQEAADNLISVLVDMLTDQELKEFGTSDSALKKAMKEYTIEDESDEEHDEW